MAEQLPGDWVFHREGGGSNTRNNRSVTEQKAPCKRIDRLSKPGTELGTRLLGAKRPDHTHGKWNQRPPTGPATDQGEFTGL